MAIRLIVRTLKQIHFLTEYRYVRGWLGNPYTRSKYPTQLAKMSLDEILDLKAEVFSFGNNEKLRLFSNVSMYSHCV